ncbi:MAG: hypothetical protein ABR608_09420 [Pseudonocardiaceae bacterium]
MDKQHAEEPEVDLEREDVRDRHGNRITSEYLERALADILDKDAPVEPSEVRRGRPSLSGGSTHSPQVTFRLPDQLHRQAVDAAEREGKTVSALAREALEQYLRQS